MAKYSGVEWIGDIPKEWSIKKAKYITSFINGYAFDSDAMQSVGKYPVIRIGDIDGKTINFANCLFIDNNVNLEKYKIMKDDLLLAMSGATVGKTGFSYKNYEAYINQRVGIIRSCNNKFVNYFLKTSYFDEFIKLISVGSAQPNISSINFGEFKMTLPSNMEQKLIVDFLDEKVFYLEEILSDLNKQIEILNDYRKTIIMEITTKGLDKNVEYKDSGVEWIGTIPKHWKITKNKYQIKIHNGKEIIDDIGEIPVYGTGGCFKNTNDYLYNGESVLLGRKGTIDNPMYVKGKFWTVDTCYYTTSYGKLMLKLFYYFSMCFDYKYYQTGSTLPSMTQYDLGSICIPDIPMNEQKEIVDYLDNKCSQIDKIIEEKQKQIEKIEEYKKSVIYEYVTGKKRVEGAEELYG